MSRTVITAVIAGMAVMFGTFAQAKVVERTLAIVNGEAIMYSEFDKQVSPFIEQYKQSTPPAEQSEAEIKEFKQKALDDMINRKLLNQEAKKQKIRVTKREIDEGIKMVKKRFPSDAEFQAELKKEGMTTAQFEKQIEEQLMVQKLITQSIGPKVKQPTEDETRALFDQIQARMAGKEVKNLSPEDQKIVDTLARNLKNLTSEQVHAKHILVAVDKDAPQKDKAAALQKIKKIQQELKAGADFEDLAQKYSDDPGSKNRGGDLGFFAKGMMVPEFEKVAFSLNVGQVSDPVQTDFGYHLIKVEEKRAPRKLSYDDVKKDLEDILTKKSEAEQFEKWLKDLRAKANIKVNPIE